MADQRTRKQKRTDRRDAFEDRKVKAARTPWQRLTVTWDQWRRLALDLPEEFRDEVAERMTRHLNQEIWDLKRR